MPKLRGGRRADNMIGVRLVLENVGAGGEGEKVFSTAEEVGVRWQQMEGTHAHCTHPEPRPEPNNTHISSRKPSDSNSTENNAKSRKFSSCRPKAVSVITNSP
jgi:hypothetical protein